MEIVQDTNVFVAALRSAEVLDRCLARKDLAVMGAALFAEYEELLHRESLWRGVPVTAAEREALLDDFCAAAMWGSQFISDGGPTCRIRRMTTSWNWR